MFVALLSAVSVCLYPFLLTLLEVKYLKRDNNETRKKYFKRIFHIKMCINVSESCW